MMYVPWLLALVTAGAFALLAGRVGRNLVPWALTGGAFALVVGTIVLGLGQATDNPFSDQQLVHFHLRWVLEAVLTILVLGWVVTLPLHRQHLTVWHKATGKALPTPPSAAPAPAPVPDPKAKAEAPKPKAEAPKQPSRA